MPGVARAADEALVTKAPSLWGSSVPMWFEGYLELGGRFYLNDPQTDGIASQGGKSLAKFNEYRDTTPGPFVNGHASAGTRDGLYQVDVYGTNVGYRDQRLGLEASKIGEQYFSFEWDQTPHNYGVGHTIYNGAGTGALTLPPGLSNTLFIDAGCIAHPGAPPTGCTGSPTAAQAAKINADIQNNLHEVNIGILRETASVNYRWTPTDAWDVRVNYDHLSRSGTQVDGVVFSPGTSGVASQVMKPVNDVTHNFGASGEYAGTSPWGRSTFKVGYTGSVFQEGINSYTVQNPFCPTNAGPGECARGGSPSSPLALMSLWPSNQANGFAATYATDLPSRSRFVSTTSYTMMRQNDAFQPFTASALIYTVGNTTLKPPPALPASSLNGAINTLLSNNVLTTQITPDLKSKISYRYYNFDNETPEIFFPNWVLTDVKLASAQNPTYAPVNSLSVSYVKQDAAAGLNWRPSREWNVGADYNFERYDWHRADVNRTNENSGKIYADWTPVRWLTTRASWLFSERRYDTYNYLGYVGMFQWPNDTFATPNTTYSTAFRQFYLDNRDRNKGQLSLSIDVIRGLTVTPTLGWQLDDYHLNSRTEEGLNSDHSWSAGIEAAYLVGPDTRLLFAYMSEQHNQLISSDGQTNPPFNPATYYFANVRDRVNTFIGSVDHAFVPEKFDVKVSYAISSAVDSQPIYFANGTQPGSGAAGSQYPNVTTLWQRLDATAKYKFDRETVQRLGWSGDMFAKLYVAWESNRVINWQNDVMQTYMWANSGNLANAGYMTWLAFDNPNYNVVMLMASLAFKW